MNIDNLQSNIILTEHFPLLKQIYNNYSLLSYNYSFDQFLERLILDFDIINQKFLKNKYKLNDKVFFSGMNMQIFGGFIVQDKLEQSIFNRYTYPAINESNILYLKLFPNETALTAAQYFTVGVKQFNLEVV